VAVAFDNHLLKVNPPQFGGSASQRNYVFYSIVGLIAKDDPLEPYLAAEPVTDAICTTADKPGIGYQWLSNMTGGVRYPVCNHLSYDAVFDHLAASVIDIATVPCQIDLPEPPAGQIYALDAIELVFTSCRGASDSWNAVDDAAACGPDSFYFDEDDPTTIHLCPEACAVVEADQEATLALSIPCSVVAE
jgi:hypothetical protein